MPVFITRSPLDTISADAVVRPVSFEADLDAAHGFPGSDVSNHSNAGDVIVVPPLGSEQQHIMYANLDGIENDPDGLARSYREILEKAISESCEMLISTRAAEGEHLKEDIIGKLNGLLDMVKIIEERSPEMMAAYRKKLTEKLNEVITDTNLSEQLIAGELILYADKICVDEETVRLRTHIVNMKKTLEGGENIGRKLDFLAQEMNREANTTLSKANDIEISEVAINIKTEIEKIREQIQNIE